MNSGARIGVIGIIFLALLSVLMLRLWTMQVNEVQAYEERAEQNQVRVVYTPAPRGDIYDSNGVKLAGTRSALAAVVDLALVDSDELEMLARNLSAFLDVSSAHLLDELENPSAGAQVTVAADLSEYQATFLAEHRETFPGVNIVPQPVRVYPEGDLASHVVGYIGRPNEEDLERENVKGTTFVGRAGVERYYDDELLGTEGIVQYQVDSRRKVLALAGEEVPTAGGSLVLTIDAELQRQLQDSLRDGLIEARRIEMDQRTGALNVKSRADRLAEALESAQRDAREAAADESDTSDEQAGTAPAEDDDDVAPVDEEITIDEAAVLESLYKGLPIDESGVCVPVERVTVPLEGVGVLSGEIARVARLDGVDDVDGSLVATMTIDGETYIVRDNQSFAGTVQVLAVQEHQVILYHRDRWCPVRSVGVVMDPTDGSVLAMASYPTYDPSIFIGGLSDDQWASFGSVSAFQNFAVQGLYAPASTFKTVPYILAMEEDFYPLFQAPADWNEEGPDGEHAEPDPILSHTDPYLCNGQHAFDLVGGGVETKSDWRDQGHGLLDLHGALVQSCDLYFWDIARSLWRERDDDSGVDKENLLQEYARMFGFGTATGIDLPFERDGLIPDRAWFRAEQREQTGRVRADGDWLGGDLMDIAVGQGAVLTTPLQMASGYSAMVNGGTLWEPRVVSRVVDSDGSVLEENPATVIREIGLSPVTTQWLRDDLRDVVNDLGGPKVQGGYSYFGGTAKDAFKEWRQDEDFGRNVALVGGKTGTGEVIKVGRGEDEINEVDNAWFMGVAPINNPKYVISIVVERGGSGGRVAAPIAVQILQYLLNGAEGVSDTLAEGSDSD